MNVIRLFKDIGYKFKMFQQLTNDKTIANVPNNYLL